MASSDAQTCDRCGGDKSALPLGGMSLSICFACAEDRVAEWQRTEAIRAAEETKIKVDIYLSKSGIPAALVASAPEALRQKAAAISSNMTCANGVVRLHGPTGTGKSTVAALIADQWIRQKGRKAVFASALRITSRIQGGYRGGFDDPGADDVFDSYCSAPLLAIDDLLAEGASSDSVRWITGLVDERINSQRITVITTNLPLGELASAYGDRLASRLAGGVAVNLGGDDHRLDALKGKR